MYKNLDGETFGITGRQNEVIELARSYGFEGINVDLSEMLSRAKSSGQEFATRYIDSAEVKVGGFKLPIKVTTDPETFKTDLAKLRECCDIAKAINATVCIYELEPATTGITYQDNFELHRERLSEVADVLKEHQIKLGLSFNALPNRREGKDSPFIFEIEPVLTLIKTIGRPNVGLALDLFHWTVAGGTLDQISELSADQIVSVRLVDMPEDFDPATATAEQRLLPGTVEGSQCLALVKMLLNKNYEGPITPGHSSAVVGRNPRDSMVQRCRNSIDAILVEAGVIDAPTMPVVPQAVETPTETSDASTDDEAKPEDSEGEVVENAEA